jgi:hypothetical protein
MRFMALPPSFKELAEAFTNPNLSGWSIGSAEAGWATPTEEEWGKPAAAPESTPVAQLASE